MQMNQEKNNSKQTWKRSELFLLSLLVRICLENSKKINNKLNQTINELSKVMKYKNQHTQMDSLYIHKWLMRRKHGWENPTYKSQRDERIFRNKLNLNKLKHSKLMWTKLSFPKDTKEHLNIPCSWSGHLSIIKIPIKIPFYGTRRTDNKVHMNN